MANGNGVPRIPGFSGTVGWNVTLSNAAIALGALSLIAITWLSANQNRRIPGLDSAPIMDDKSLVNEVEADVYSFAASHQTVSENRDRIRSAIQRLRDTFQAAREAYIKKIRDLHIALRNKTITMDQYRTQRRAAHTEFIAAIRARHREIMELLHIPHRAHDHVVTPTLG